MIFVIAAAVVFNTRVAMASLVLTVSRNGSLKRFGIVLTRMAKDRKVV